MHMQPLLNPKKMTLFCPCCGFRFRSFNGWDYKEITTMFATSRYEGIRQDVLCPICRALPRHRILALWCEKHIQELKKSSILSFAPERSMMQWMPRGGEFYRLAMYVYLAVGGGAVHLPCGVFMWIYRSVTEAAGPEAGREIALNYLLYFLLPVTVVFTVFFTGANVVQFIAFVKGRTPFPKWYCVFNLLIGKGVFNAARQLGNTALFNGIGTSNMSLGAIVMFTALLLDWRKYAGDEGYER